MSLSDVKRMLQVTDGTIVLDGMGLLIPPGAECAITSRRQEDPLRCRSFVVPPDIAPHFHVVDLKIGHHSIFAGWAPDGVPASQNTDYSFAKNTRIVQYMMDVEIRVRNTSDQPRMFRATIYGNQAQLNLGGEA
jgi:hypothetical protein